MTAFNTDGVFWLPTNPESHIAGRLQFDIVDGGKLDLIGTLSSASDVLNDANVPKVLHGVAGGHKYTLRDCQRTNFNMSMPGIEREAYHVPEIIRGVHITSDTDFKFVAFRMNTRYLSHWIGTTGISYEWEPGSLDHYGISYDRPESEVDITGFGTIEICYGWNTDGDNFLSSGISHSTFVKATFDTPLPLEDVCSIVSSIQDIITLGMDVTAITTGLSLEHEQHTRELADGRIVHEHIELFKPWLGADIPESKTRTNSDDILVTFDDMGRVAGLSRWLKTHDMFRLTINSLLSHRYMPKMYGENRLQNAVFAAESFDRARFKNRVESRENFRARRKRILEACPQDREWLDNFLQYANEPRLVDRLLRLARYAGGRFEYLVGNVEAWARHVKNVRNRLVHSEGSSDGPDGLTLFLLSESVYFLVVICLLRECGIGDVMLDDEFDNRRFRHLHDQLREHFDF